MVSIVLSILICIVSSELIEKELIVIEILNFVKNEGKLIVSGNLFVENLVCRFITFLVELAFGVLGQRDQHLLEVLIKRLDLLDYHPESLILAVHHLAKVIFIDLSIYHLLYFLRHH